MKHSAFPFKAIGETLIGIIHCNDCLPPAQYNSCLIRLNKIDIQGSLLDFTCLNRHINGIDNLTG